MLALTFDPSFTAASEILSGYSFITKRYESAGRAFKERFEGLPSQSEEKSTDDQPESEPSETFERTNSKKEKKSNSFRLPVILEDIDLYELFELDEAASADQIKTAYRKLVLLYHPDKRNGGDEKKTDKQLKQEKKLFLQLQAAYEILSNPEKRRQYESTRPFDDKVPTSLPDGEDFYKVFGEAFDRNTRWSAKRPVPKIGDAKTPKDAVNKFYDFWFNLQSVRDFSWAGEHNTEEATCRDEKRWMEKENLRKIKKMQTEENGRILRMVEAAYKIDPRLVAWRLEEQQKKEAERAKKLHDKFGAAKEAKQREEEAKRLKEEQEAAEKLKQKEEKAAIKALRPQIKQILRGLVDEEQLQQFLLTITTLGEMQGLLESLKIDEDPATIYHEFRTSRVKTVDSASKKKVADEKPVEWTQAELALFQKAITKFPVGVPKRWEQVALFVCTKSLEEVVAMNKRFAEDKKIQQVAKPVKHVIGTGTLSTASTAAAAVAADEVETPVAIEEPLERTVTTNKDAWSEQQQKALEKALKQFPVGCTGDRWQQISEQVAEKSKEECMARFKWVRELLKSQQAATNS
jgi:DnaJ homolog subfamily C member 2